MITGSFEVSFERDKPTRRSDTILQTRRRPLPWPNDDKFRILSIDGGGIKGVFPAAILTYLEETRLDGQPIGDYFDLVAGTSTGGILSPGAGIRTTGALPAGPVRQRGAPRLSPGAATEGTEAVPPAVPQPVRQDTP